ncbi:MAG: hypothetical protein AAGG01_17745, partial [Planctomycetota bacterium]
RILASRDVDAAIAAFEEALRVFEAGEVSMGHRLLAQEELANALLQSGVQPRALELLEQVAKTQAARRGESDARTVAVRERIRTLRLQLDETRREEVDSSDDK